MKRIVPVAKAVAIIFGAAFVMAAWSELVFFNESVAEGLVAAIPAGGVASLRFLSELALFYAIPGAVAYAAVATWGSAGPARVMLIAALLGFTIEGALVPAVYEAPPVSYLWTSVAWHGPVTAGLGLFLMPRLLSTERQTILAIILVALGLGWGLWTPWTWGIDGMTPLPPDEFLAFSFWTTLSMCAGYLLLSMSNWPEIAGPKAGVWGIAVLAGALFVLNGLQHPIAAVGVFGLLAGLLLLLGRLGPAQVHSCRIKLANLAMLWLLPLAAWTTYALQYASSFAIPSEDLAAIAFFGGTLIWATALIRGLRHPIVPQNLPD